MSCGRDLSVNDVEAFVVVAAEHARAGVGGAPQHLLEVNDRYAGRLLELQLEWLDAAERALRRRAPRRLGSRR